ncbi:fungal-specific transcription factor domain-containing protein [Aspergillus keveii]|uniref:Fungal-specific transcription factor domain-containing protein n=1 Tax=Aspergillus keveii TaxID=714993 RepID=A0ABR4GFL8_9EURO
MASDSRLPRASDEALIPQESPSPRRRSNSGQRLRKLRKITRACDACKAKKKACTGTIPCGPCVRRKADCTYNTTYNRGAAVTPPPSGSHLEHNAPTPASRQITQETESDAATPFEPPGRRHSTDVGDQYWGPTSAHSFLGWAVRDLPPTPSNAGTSAQESARTSKASIFHFGDRVPPDVQLTDFQWPDRMTADSLTRRYFEFACPTYRTLHQPTIEGMIHEIYGEDTHYDGYDSSNGESAAAFAILLMAFGTATMFRSGADGRMRDADESGWVTSERYFAKAEQLLSQETGVPTLESVQARFLMVLYLISSSRANKAWFTLGTAIQLMMALGLHRRSNRDNTGENLIQRECRRRTVWCSYTLDKYLSVILGRPRLWHDGDVDEELPARVNDIDLTPTRIELPKRDCVMDAPVLHAILSRTLSQAAKEPYVVAGISNRDQLNTIRNLCNSVTEWQAGLPPLLSGAIHPSSLVPVFQRQLTVLQLARYHLLMFITRPLLLRNYGQIWPDCEASYFHYLGVCLTAARDAIELVLSFVRENQLFHAFWYSQYITFNALSIIYIYLIQVQRGRLVPISATLGRSPNGTNFPPLDEATLYRLSETAQYHLADATVRNAPSWKYSAILQGLRRELERLGLRTPIGAPPNNPRESATREVPPALIDNTLTPTAHPIYHQGREAEQVPAAPPLGEPSGSAMPFSGIPRLGDPYFPDSRTEYLFDSFATDKDLMLDFWPQLDSLPISYLGN